MTPEQLISKTVAAVRPLDGAAMDAARARQASLTKPPGSLGVLEDVSVRLAGIARSCPAPVPSRAVVAVFAADHGVVASGVTPWPQEVTTAMVENFRAGGAAVNVLAAQAGADVVVVDIGVAADVKEDAVVWARKVRPGTDDLAVGPAMSRQEAAVAVMTGIRVAEELVSAGYDVVATGDMGIGNTTASACLIARLTGSGAETITGRGTGIDDAMLAHKTGIVAAAVARIPADADALDVLAEVGGLEHAGLAGLILGCAARGVPVVLDGVIAGAAALVAQALSPDCRRPLRRRAPQRRAGSRRRARGPRPPPAGRPRPAAGRGEWCRAGAAPGALRCGRAPGHGHVRVRRDPHMSDHPPYPSGLRLAGRRVVVVGGGHVAQRRVPVLIGAGADVVVVAPEVTPAIEGLTQEITIHLRGFEDHDLEEAWYVIAATDDPAVNAAVADSAERRRIFCVRADDARAATAWTPAVGRHEGVTVAVLGNREPRKSAAIRDEILHALREGVISAVHDHTPGVVLVGGGPGDPELVTIAARNALASADVVVADRLAPRELLDELSPEVELVDVAKLPRGRSASQDEINRVIVDRALAGKRVVRFKGGDNFVFGRGYEELLACAEAGVPVTIVPGLSSAISVPARAGIPGHPPRAWRTSSPSSPDTCRRGIRTRSSSGRRWPGCAAPWCC